MARVGLIELREESFTADGREISFRKAYLVQLAGSFELLIKERPEHLVKAKKKAAARKARTRAAAADPLLEALKKWRLAVAKKEGVPAFRVLTDKALAGIADICPSNLDQLLQVPGVGPRAISRYGAGILKVLGTG
jgi:superfamily II DNA helicase RecQ